MLYLTFLPLPREILFLKTNESRLGWAIKIYLAILGLLSYFVPCFFTPRFSRKSIALRLSRYFVDMCIPAKMHPITFFYSKLRTYNFLDEMGIKRPDIIYQGRPDRIGCLTNGKYVVKPDYGASSKGVLQIVFRSGVGYVAANNKKIKFTELADLYKNQWRCNYILIEKEYQDRVHAIVVDYKAYYFKGYGVALLQVIENCSKCKLFQYFNREGELVNPGKNEKEVGQCVFDKLSILRIISYCEGIGDALPFSFLRIDVYDCKKGIIVGELTPAPGNCTDFFEAWDIKLGKIWHEAEKKQYQCYKARLASSEILKKSGVTIY